MSKENDLKYYDKGKEYFFQGLDELEIYLKRERETRTNPETWELLKKEEIEDERDKLCNVSDYLKNVIINEALNDSNKPDTNIILSWLNFAVTPANKIMNYTHGYKFTSVINWIVSTLFAIYFWKEKQCRLSR